MLMVQASPEADGASREHKVLGLGQHEIPELLQRIGLGHLTGSYQPSNGATTLQNIHDRLLDMQASQPSTALQVYCRPCARA